RFAGDFKNDLLKALNFIPGVNFKIKDGNLDELLLGLLAGNIISQINDKVQDIHMDVRSYDHYTLAFKYFSLVDGHKAKIEKIEISKGFFEIHSKIQPSD
ncbi:hypothetical protein MJH12_13825, partial [bacterium]|nr:hypothetical protein [bacterium]